MEPRFVAVVDIGKTNAKLVLHDLVHRSDVAARSTSNAVAKDGPYPHYDVERLFAFLVSSLGEIAAARRIDAIAITAHGASAALVTDSGLALPVLDYEFDIAGPETDEYVRLRPDFAETLSPRMAKGLNLGNQIFWQQRRFPEEFARVRHILTYPQYWAWRLTGIAAFEPTSMGTHTDLWSPGRNDFSSLVDRLGWRDLFPARGTAFDVLGPLQPEIAKAAGLSEHDAIPVLSGIHDSNASLLPHLLARPAPFTVVSTGTWVVSFAVGGHAVALDAAQGTLAYVDVFGRPVPSSLFMGGREFDMLTGGDPSEPDEAAIARIVAGRIMALPSFVAGSGPFPDGIGRWTTSPEDLAPPERTAVASLYAAMMTDTALRMIGAEGPTVVEGPFARNALFVRVLSGLTGRAVDAPTFGTGTSGGAALLALGRPDPHAAGTRRSEKGPAARPIPGLGAYAERWRALAAGAPEAGAPMRMDLFGRSRDGVDANALGGARPWIFTTGR